MDPNQIMQLLSAQGITVTKQQVDDLTTSFKSATDTITQFGQSIFDTVTNFTDVGTAFDQVKAAIMDATGATEEQMESFTAGVGGVVAYKTQIALLEGELGGLAGATRRVIRDQLESARSFNQGTGFAGQYNQKIIDATFRNREFGLSGAEMGDVYTNLTKTFTDFTKGGISPAETALADAAVALEAVGIGSETTAATFQILRKGLNQSEGSIVRSTLGLENFAEELGVTSQEMFTTFNTQMPSMLMFGSEAERVFRQTAAAAKSTGLEFSKFQEVFNLTDTFEGSTQAVGQLNALLGGPFLNSVELTMAETPVERMQMLSQAFQDAGVSVENMSRRQIQAFVAATPGINNALELTQLLDGGFNDLIDTTDAVAKSQSELSDEAQKRRTTQDNMQILEDVALGVDGIAQKLDVVNQNTFTPAIESAENLRNAVVGNEGISAALEIVNDMLTNIGAKMGVTTENLEKIKGESIAARDREAGKVQKDSEGQPVYRFQIFLDGKEIDARVAALDAP